MKALQTTKPYELRFMEIDKPAIMEDTQVIVQMKAVGICGSDVHIYHGTSPVATYPRIMGHEMVGVVHTIGTGVAAVAVGDPVIINQIVHCGTCHACVSGRPNVCFHLQVRGVHIDGGYQEYLRVNQTDLYKLPKELPFHQAVMIEPTSIAYQALSRAEVVDTDTVLVLGAGALGKSLVKALALTQARIIVADVAAPRLEEALALGAHLAINSGDTDLVSAVQAATDGFGVTVAIDAAGIVSSLEVLAQATCPAGRVITMGFMGESSKVKQLHITAKELDIRGSRLQNNKFAQVIADYQAGKLHFEGLVSHQIPFEQAPQAFAMIDAGDTSIKKVVLTFDH